MYNTLAKYQNMEPACHRAKKSPIGTTAVTLKNISCILKMFLDLSEVFVRSKKPIQQMVDQHIKQYSTPSFIKEMQIKTTVRYYTPTRMAVIKKGDDNKSW